MCPLCPASFSKPANRNKHMRNRHPEALLNRGQPTSYIPMTRVVNEPPIVPTAVKEDQSLMTEDPPVTLVTPNGTKRKRVSSVEETASIGTKRSAAEAFGYDDYFQDNNDEDAFCNQAMDELLPEEEDFFNSQGDGDALCNAAYDLMFPEQPIHHDQPSTNEEYRTRAAEQTGGNPIPLFDFQLSQIGPRRRWLNVTSGIQYHAELVQHRDPTERDDLGIALSEALFRVIHRELVTNHPRAKHVNFSLTAHGFQHAFQSINLNVNDFRTRTDRLDEMLRTLAGKLNSNEEFNPQQGFQLDIVFVEHPPPASGRGRKRQVGLKNFDQVCEDKQCIIKIKNEDQLCCARAIVSMQAWADWKAKEKQLKEEQSKDIPDQTLLESLQREVKMKKNNYDYLTRKAEKSKAKQGDKAKQLHQEAGVPEGPCSYEQWKQFQDHLTPEYQLQILCGMKPFKLLYQGPAAPKQINLVKFTDHMVGCTSFPAFVNRSYWCPLCGKGYDHEDAKNHPCEGRTCKACNSKTCPDYDMGKHPRQHCRDCNGYFYGSKCYQEHKTKKICERFNHCPHCSAEYKVIKGKPHRCGFASCPSCKEHVNIQDHKCFIQPIVDDPEPEEDEEGNKKKPPLEPFFVYADIEAMILPDRSFEPNLLCYRTHEDDRIHSHWGKQGCLDFLHDLDALTEVPDDDRERPIIVIFHNLKGFDGVFMLYELYGQSREVTKQLTVGAKVLCFKSGPLTFKDSLCFLNMPLAAFPATFGLTEMKKGYFPHAFNTPENQNYRGRLPDKDYHDPEKMMENEKKAFDIWYAEQERQQEAEGYVFDLRKELESYCHSDVALLQAGCEAFCKEFQEHAGFNPIANCVTIASACNEYWRRHHLPLNTIAVEPLRGWRGARVNQSVKALQWLYYQESLIPKEGACAEQIKHVRNGGEQSLITGTDPVFVDGYNPRTNTVYEFHGCLWHGCEECYKKNRDVKHVVNADRTLEELRRATRVKTNTLRNAGYTVVEMWECDWDKQVRGNPHVKAFVESLTWIEPLEPRDAFFGGRTGAASLYAMMEGEVEGHYVDITSLYPFINKTGVYPVDILRLSHNHIKAWTIILGWPKWTYYPRLNCFTRSYQ